MTRSELLEKAKPILFNTEMARAILGGRKTVTRRVALPNKDLREFHSGKYPNGWWLRGNVYKDWDNAIWGIELKYPPKYKVGDILYVRETWAKISDWIDCDPDCRIFDGYIYKSEWGNYEVEHPNWRPSIHMPKEAARIFLRVTGVRVERLQDCGNMQAKDEGCNCCSQFVRIWDSTVKKSDLEKYGWNVNPWVWVIEFERISKEESYETENKA